MEITVKVCVLQLLIYLSQQRHFVVLTYVASMLFITTFLWVEIVTYQLAYFPKKTQCCAQLLHCRIARNQFVHSHLKSQKGQRRQIVRRTFRVNLLVQQVSESELGFTMGSLYTITRYQWFEMLMLNLGFLSLFYNLLVNS